MSWSSINELADAVEDRLDLVDVLVRGVLVMLEAVAKDLGERISGAAAEGEPWLLTELV